MKKPAKAARPAKSASAPHKVRISGGVWKRTPVAVLDSPGLRPTPDRVRETLFNWLSHLLGPDFGKLSALDLFAGSGVLGFEAASRGFASVTSVEKDPKVFAMIAALKEKLRAEKFHAVRGDAFESIRGEITAGRKYDVIFLDPPFKERLLPQILPLCRRALNAGGLVYAESDEPLKPGDAADFRVIRQSKAGQVHFHLLEAGDSAVE